MNLPPVGFGTAPRGSGPPVDWEEPVRRALAAGYRLFDLAELYGNEKAVGRALASAAAPPRGELFLAGKLWRTHFRPERVRAACADSLARLGVDSFDLYLLHAPGAWRFAGPLDEMAEIGRAEFERRAVPRTAGGELATDDVPLAETWEALRELVGQGLARHVGVSNFAPADLALLGGPPPAANEIEFNPHRRHRETVDHCRREGVRLLAHSPLSSPGLLAEPALREIAARHRRTPAQVVLRWIVERGLVPLPSTADPDRLAENLAIFDFALNEDERAAIAGLEKPLQS